MRMTTLILALAAATSLSAQEGTKWVALQGGAVAHDNKASNPFKEGMLLGLEGGWWLNDRWGVAVGGQQARIEHGGLDIKANEYHYSACNRSGPRPYPGYGPDRSDEPSQVVMSDGLRKPCSRAMLTLRR